MGRPRKIEMAASDYFGGAAIAKGDNNLRSKAAEDNCSPRDGEDEGGRGDGGSRPAARADRGPCSPRKKKRASRTVDDDDDDGDFEPTRSDDDSEDDFLPSAAKEGKSGLREHGRRCLEPIGRVEGRVGVGGENIVFGDS